MNPEDQKLFAELYRLREQLKEKRDSMRVENNNRACLCGPDGSCAWHAAVYNFLESSIVSLTHAMTYLQAPRDGGL